jgi:hypothetical protein
VDREWEATNRDGDWDTILFVRAHYNKCVRDGGAIADQQECVNNVQTRRDEDMFRRHVARDHVQ